MALVMRCSKSAFAWGEIKSRKNQPTVCLQRCPQPHKENRAHHLDESCVCYPVVPTYRLRPEEQMKKTNPRHVSRTPIVQSHTPIDGHCRSFQMSIHRNFFSQCSKYRGSIGNAIIKHHRKGMPALSLLHATKRP